MQIAEQAKRSGPEPLQLGPQLVDQRRPGTDQILPPAGQRPDRLRGIRVGLEHPEAMMIGPRELAQHERVKPIGLAARHAKPVTGRRHLIGVQRQHPQPRVQQPLDHQPVRPLHRDQLHPQPHQLPAQRPQPLLVMRERCGQQLLARRIRDEHVVLLRRPINASVTSPSVTTPLGQDNSTAPRPRGTVADAHRQGPQPGLRPVAASRHLTTAGRGWSFVGPPTRASNKRALPRRRSRQQQDDL